MKSMLFFCLSFGLSASLVQAQNQNPYLLDPYFGNAGVQVSTNPPWGTLQYRSYNVKNMAIGADDKIVLAGNQTPNFAPHFLSGGNYAITRLNANGTLDTSFAGTGHKILQSGANGAPVLELNHLIVLPDNKIIYAGTATATFPSNMVIYKVNVDGSFDATFGTNGQVVFSSGPLVWHSLDALGVQSSGKLLLLGKNFDNNAPTVGSISRLNANGSTDNSFGNNGVLVPNLGFSDNQVNYSMIKVLSDNSFLVTGTHVQQSPAVRQNFVAKFDANGILQTNFGNNGKIILPIANGERLYFYNNDIEVASDGAIYINCSTNGGGANNQSVLVYKLSSNGVLVNNYGQNGRLSLPAFHYDSWYFYDAQLQGDKLLVAAMIDTGLNAPYRLQRFNSDGTEDLTFANPLSHITATRNALDHSFYLGLQSNNRIMLGGYGKRDDKAADSIFPVVMRFLEQGTEQPPVDTGTSVVNIKDQSKIKVYPNPARSLFYIEGIKGNARVQLFDVSGKLVLNSTIQGSQAIDCGQLAAGIYWLYLKEANSNTIYSHKVVKQ